MEIKRKILLIIVFHKGHSPVLPPGWYVTNNNNVSPRTLYTCPRVNGLDEWDVTKLGWAKITNQKVVTHNLEQLSNYFRLVIKLVNWFWLLKHIYRIPGVSVILLFNWCFGSTWLLTKEHLHRNHRVCSIRQDNFHMQKKYYLTHWHLSWSVEQS